MNNLFISYELSDAEKNIESVDKAIESLGNSTKLHQTFWYVNSPENAEKAIKRISRFLSKDDKLVICDASNNETTWFNLDDKRSQRVRQNWKL